MYKTCMYTLAKCIYMVDMDIYGKSIYANCFAVHLYGTYRTQKAPRRIHGKEEVPMGRSAKAPKYVFHKANHAF